MLRHPPLPPRHPDRSEPEAARSLTGGGLLGKAPPASVGRSGGPPSCLHTLRGPPGPAGSAPATPRSSRVPRGPAPRVEFEVKLSVASCQRLCMLWRQKSCSGFYGPGVGARGQHGASICVCVCARAEAHVCTHVCMRVPPRPALLASSPGLGQGTVLQGFGALARQGSRASQVGAVPPQDHRVPRSCPERPPGPWGYLAVSAEGPRGLGRQRVPQDLQDHMVVKVQAGTGPPGGAICSVGPAMLPKPGLGLWGTRAGAQAGGHKPGQPPSPGFGRRPVSPPEPGAPSGRDLPCTHPEGSCHSWGLSAVHPLGPGCGALLGARSNVPSRGGRAPPLHAVPLPTARRGLTPAGADPALCSLLAGRPAPLLHAHPVPVPVPTGRPSGAA